MPRPRIVMRKIREVLRLKNELRRKGVTLQLLHDEYLQQHPDDGYQYSQFFRLYYEWRRHLDVVVGAHGR